MQHFLLTRFNVQWPFNKENIDQGIDPTWLLHRMKMLQRFTVPSIQSQTNQDFEWILLCHHQTPDVYRKTLEKLGAITIYDPPPAGMQKMQEIASEMFSVNINSKLKKNTKYVITTRIDSDDALSKNYVNRIQECGLNNIHDKSSLFLDFFNGVVINNDKYWKCSRNGDRPRPSNFISRIETVKFFKTVFQFTHYKSSPCLFIYNEQGWAEMHHNYNIWNGRHESSGGHTSPSGVKRTQIEINDLIEDFPFLTSNRLFL